MQKAKNKKCRVCRSEFIPFRTTDAFCSRACHEICQRKQEEKKLDRKRIDKGKADREKKKKQVPALKKALWEIYSQYIRTRETDDEGFCECVTCGKQAFWQDMQAGHFIPQSSGNYLRYNDENVHAQCLRCNCYLHGNIFAYEEYMIRRYWSEKVEKMKRDRLIAKSFKPFELISMIEEYTRRLQTIKCDKPHIFVEKKKKRKDPITL